jgi:hypothetical protein
LLAKVEFPILGMDFLRHYKLAVDVAAGQLLHTETLQQLDTSTGELARELSSILAFTPSTYRILFSEFSEVTDPSGRFPPAKHKVEHHIVTSGRPVTARFRRLDPEKLVAAKAEFKQMKAAGIIRRSDSCWSSPLHMVRKPNATWCPCGDYRRLNLVTRPDKYPVPNMTNLAARLHSYKVFSKLNFKKGYYQVPVRAEEMSKTAVITPFGLWEFLRLLFGLRNVGQSFQRLMDTVGAGPFFCVYLSG